MLNTFLIPFMFWNIYFLLRVHLHCIIFFINIYIIAIVLNAYFTGDRALYKISITDVITDVNVNWTYFFSWFCLWSFATRLYPLYVCLVSAGSHVYVWSIVSINYTSLTQEQWMRWAIKESFQPPVHLKI